MNKRLKLIGVSILTLALLTSCIHRVCTFNLHFKYCSLNESDSYLTPTWDDFIFDTRTNNEINKRSDLDYFIAGDYLELMLIGDLNIQESYPARINVSKDAGYLEININYAEVLKIDPKEIYKKDEDYFYKDYKILNSKVMINLDAKTININEVTSPYIYMSIQSDLFKDKNIGFGLYDFNPRE